VLLGCSSLLQREIKGKKHTHTRILQTRWYQIRTNIGKHSFCKQDHKTLEKNLLAEILASLTCNLHSFRKRVREVSIGKWNLVGDEMLEKEMKETEVK
jgi:hypothetical protein